VQRRCKVAIVGDVIVASGDVEQYASVPPVEAEAPLPLSTLTPEADGVIS
jgi:hypothetical protein